jgi:cyclopropane fatty-acyl-phospholipid synthase-like methyltransferase
MKSGIGQYDQEYAQCPCFWGTAPGKYVLQLPDSLTSGRVLDLGAGEGKNAVYLASKGFEVVAVDCSEYAIRNFRSRLRDVDPAVANRIEIMCQDVTAYVPSRSFDLVIAYGLLHCLPSYATVCRVVSMMQECTLPGGTNVVVTFTDKLPVPSAQAYLEPTLLPQGGLQKLYAHWEVVKCEDDVITETHPTSTMSHSHSLCRLLARKSMNSALDI